MEEENTEMFDFSMTAGMLWYVVTVLLHASQNRCYNKSRSFRKATS